MTRIAVTGGSGFVGRHLVRHLLAEWHEVAVVTRGGGAPAPNAGGGEVPWPNPHVAAADLTDPVALAEAFAGCEAVVHLAGISRELREQTFEAVHVRGTAAVVEAARQAGVRRIVLLSFLRARPDGPSAYHRSKWAGEALIRGSGLDHVIVKAGVIHGRGDHLLGHVGRALHTVPVFGLVGLRDQPVAPLAVADIVRLLAAAALGDKRLRNRTIAAVGPESLTLGGAIRRIAAAAGRRVLVVPTPVWVHRGLARIWEAAMTEPLVARGQVEILAEGVVEALPFAEPPPPDLAPATPFSIEVIRAGLPEPGGFGLADLRVARRESKAAR
jgi:NADH dehydrogenase